MSKPTHCQGCGAAITQPPRGRRLYCTNACKSRVWYGTHPGRGWNPNSEPVQPLSMPYVGHEVFEQARKIVGLNGNWSSDWGQHDLMGVATLAILEGRDPDAAIRSFRGNEKRLTNMRAYPRDVGHDGHRLIVQWHGGEDDERTA